MIKDFITRVKYRWSWLDEHDKSMIEIILLTVFVLIAYRIGMVIDG